MGIVRRLIDERCVRRQLPPAQWKAMTSPRNSSSDRIGTQPIAASYLADVRQPARHVFEALLVGLVVQGFELAHEDILVATIDRPPSLASPGGDPLGAQRGE